MEAIKLSIVVTLIHVVINVLVPGWALARYFKLWSTENSISHQLSISAAVGLLYGFLCFSLFYTLGAYTSPSTALSLAQGLPLLSIAVSFYILAKQSKASANSFSIVGVVSIFLAISYGIYAYLRVPYAIDNIVLERLIYYLNWQSPLGWQGALSYLSLVYFPSSYLFPSIPVTVVAGALRIPLTLLTLLCAFEACRILNTKTKSLSSTAPLALGFFVLMILNFHGVYGILGSAKETVFSMAFLFLFSLSLVEAENNSTWMKKNALYLATSFSLGAVTIPYSLVFIVSFIFFNKQVLNYWKWLFYITLFSAPALSLNIASMTSIYFPKALLALSFLDALFFWFSKKVPHPNLLNKKKFSTKIALIALTLVLLSCILLMPVVHTIARTPLDGQSNFFDYLLDYDPNRSRWTTALGVCGIIFSIVLKKPISQNSGFLSFLLFPWLVTLVCLLLARLPDTLLPIHGQHLWDLLKDIPNWWLGYYFSFFIVLFALQIPNAFYRLANNKLIPYLVIPILILIIFIRTSPYKLMGAYRTPYPAYFFHYGGYTQEALAKVLALILPHTELLWKKPGLQYNYPQNLVYYCKDTVLGHDVTHLKWFGMKQKEISSANPPTFFDVQSNTHTFYICDHSILGQNPYTAEMKKNGVQYISVPGN